jgi:heterodisulfide reductase subunit A-like polyferredoxin
VRAVPRARIDSIFIGVAGDQAAVEIDRAGVEVAIVVKNGVVGGAGGGALQRALIEGELDAVRVAIELDDIARRRVVEGEV